MENRRESNNSAETSETMSNDFGNDAVRLCPICIPGPPVRIRSVNGNEKMVKDNERNRREQSVENVYIDLVIEIYII